MQRPTNERIACEESLRWSQARRRNPPPRWLDSICILLIACSVALSVVLVFLFLKLAFVVYAS